MIKGGVFLALLIFSLISVMADPIIYSNCSIFGNCQPQATKGGGNQNITIFQNITNVNQTLNITNNITNIFQASNFSILVDWANLTNIPIYVKDWNLSGLIKDWSWVLNGTGLIKDWNNTGLIQDWNQSGFIKNWNFTGLILNWTNQPDNNKSGLIKDWNQSGILINWNNSMNASGLLVNYSNLNPNNYVSNSSGLIREWNNSINSTGLIRNYSSLLNGTGLIKDWNSTGFIMDWNQTGFIKDWSYLSGGSGITNGSSAWLQNLSLSGDFLVDTTTFALFVNTTSHHVGINTINPQSELNVVGDTNLTGNLNVTNNLLIDPLVSTLFVDSTNHRIGIKTTNTNLYPLNIGATSGRGINITTSGLLSSGVISLLIQMAGTNQATALEINNSAGAGSWGINSYVSKPTSLSGRFIGDFVIYNGTFDNNGNYYLYTASYNTTGNRNLTNGNITSVTLGMAVGVQTYGAKPLPPYGNSTCISAQYPMWAGNITRNSSGIYACGGSITPDNWTRIAI